MGGSSVKRQILIALLLPILAGFSGCTTSHTSTSGKSEVREAPVTNGPSANQEAWEQGRIPPVIQKQPGAGALPPVPGERTYESTTAPTGEIESTQTTHTTNTATPNGTHTTGMSNVTTQSPGTTR